MIALRRILCPVDFSETSMHALTYALALADGYRAELEVLHVAPNIDDEAQVEAEIRQAIETAGRRGLQVRALAQEGRPHEMIVYRAQAQPADLLVMGTHGRSGFDRLLLGSVAEKVVRAAPCPVLTVPSSPQAPDRPGDFRQILCPVDFSPASVAALRYALELGGRSQGTVTVLHALEYLDPLTREFSEEPEEDGDRESDPDPRLRQVVAQRQEQLRRLIAARPRTACTVEEIVEVNRAYKAILHRAAEVGADLIVMGTQGHGGVELLLFGSNTQHVLRAATCPVLTVRA